MEIDEALEEFRGKVNRAKESEVKDKSIILDLLPKDLERFPVRSLKETLGGLGIDAEQFRKSRKEDIAYVVMECRKIVSDRQRELKELDDKRRESTLRSKENWVVGDKVEARWVVDKEFYDGTIASVNADGSFDVDFDDGDKQLNVAKEDIRLREVKLWNIGDKIEALWQEDKEYYSATISDVHEDGTYDITYDDGDIAKNVSPDKIRYRQEEEVSSEYVVFMEDMEEPPQDDESDDYEPENDEAEIEDDDESSSEGPLQPLPLENDFGRYSGPIHQQVSYPSHIRTSTHKLSSIHPPPSLHQRNPQQMVHSHTHTHPHTLSGGPPSFDHNAHVHTYGNGGAPHHTSPQLMSHILPSMPSISPSINQHPAMPSRVYPEHRGSPSTSGVVSSNVVLPMDVPSVTTLLPSHLVSRMTGMKRKLQDISEGRNTSGSVDYSDSSHSTTVGQNNSNGNYPSHSGLYNNNANSDSPQSTDVKPSLPNPNTMKPYDSSLPSRIQEPFYTPAIPHGVSHVHSANILSSNGNKEGQSEDINPDHDDKHVEKKVKVS
jgi:hypothetical protein